MKITKEMITNCCLYGEKVFENQMDRAKAVSKVHVETGMDRGSAGFYIGVFCSMMEGERYTRTINTEATRFYLNYIKDKYGNNQLELALKAVEQHTNYYSTLGKGNLKSIEKLLSEFRIA